nr:peptidoglycan-binding domain-containing protein [Clostridium rhizosphaerae]
MFVNEFRVLDPGNTGSDVYEVQRRLKDKGYYSGPLDGRYGEGMKAQVIKFRKDNNLKITHTIDKEFYNAMQMKPFE